MQTLENNSKVGVNLFRNGEVVDFCVLSLRKAELFLHASKGAATIAVFDARSNRSGLIRREDLQRAINAVLVAEKEVPR